MALDATPESIRLPSLPRDPHDSATRADAPKSPPTPGQSRCLAARLRAALATVTVWALYVPHYSMLKALTPRFGFAWARFVARLHWLTTFVGSQATARANLERWRPLFDAHESVSTMLRKHLEMKHECFARVRAYHMHGVGASRFAARWRVAPGCEATHASIAEHDGGLIIVGFHHNFFEMSAAVMHDILPGREALQVKLRMAHNLEETAPYVADLATRRAQAADNLSGASVFYVDDEESLRPLIRKLRRGGTVAVAADGMYASDYHEAPFFDGTLKCSRGWARLAAMTGARVLVMLDGPGDDAERNAWMYEYDPNTDKSDGGVDRLVEGAVGRLEDAIRHEPWGWHPWQRLHRCEATDAPRYQLTPCNAADGTGATARQDHPAAPSLEMPETVAEDTGIEPSGLPAAPANQQAPKVAVLCNSVTPYRLHLHRRLVEEAPEVELWTLSTHGNAYQRWASTEATADIRPVDFGKGQPTNEQTQVRYSAREWRKGGEVIRWLRKNRVEAVFCQGCGDIGRLRVMRWCHRNGVPVFLTGDFNSRGYSVAWWKRPVKSLIYGAAVRWATALMPCGELGLELLRGYGGESKPSFPFPFCPDVSLLQDPPGEAVERVRQRFGFSPDRRRIVFSARMMPVKRPDLAIEAFAALAAERPDWDLIMLGDGPLREPSEALVPAHLRDRVIWTGFFDESADVAALYSLCDVLLLPSDHEPWGVVIVEAAAAQLAIVATDVVGASPELIRPGRNGATFPAGDAAGLADALRYVTAEEHIDEYRAASAEVHREWFDEADPVKNFRAALAMCGVVDAGDGAENASE